MRVIVARIFVQEFIELGATARELPQNLVFDIADVSKREAISINGHSPCWATAGQKQGAQTRPATPTRSGVFQSS